MNRFRVSYTEAALQDIERIWEFVVERSGVFIASEFRARILEDCMSLQVAPKRGIERNLGGAPTRAIGAAGGRVTLIFRVRQHGVDILRVHYAGVHHKYR